MARDSLPEYGSLGGARLVYEEDQQPKQLHIDPETASRLEQWVGWLPSTGLAAPTVIRTYGAWVSDEPECTSMHGAGRALDVAAVVTGGGEVSCRTDLWQGGGTPAQLAAYWRLAAGLHLHFAYVLTYLYDSLHANHIHVDDTESRGGLSRFNTQSRVQCQGVQAICRHVWGVPTDITGTWDPQTRASLKTVTKRLGISDAIGTQPQWHAFLTRSAQIS